MTGVKVSLVPFSRVESLRVPIAIKRMSLTTLDSDKTSDERSISMTADRFKSNVMETLIAMVIMPSSGNFKKGAQPSNGRRKTRVARQMAGLPSDQHEQSDGLTSESIKRLKRGHPNAMKKGLD
jgi:hypothetical protein